MEDTNSEKAGSQPENKDVKADAKPDVKTDAKPDSSPEKDVKPESSTDQPWHKDPRFKNELGLLKAAKSLMEKNGLESVEDLVELAESGKKVKGKQVDLDRLEEIQSKAEKLDKYEAYWKDQEERKKRETEYPEQTIARLEEQLKKKEAADKYKEDSRRQQEAAKQALKSYDNEVQDLIKEMELPKEQHSFIQEFFGVGNPFNEIDITDRKAIRKLVSDGIKKKQAYDQAVIQAYIKSKESVPKVSTTNPTAPSANAPKIMLKDARKALHDAMMKVTGG
jgi:DNA repair exonuclease SbcCD ATPase subunit